MEQQSNDQRLQDKFSLSIEEFSVPQVLGKVAAMSLPPSGRKDDSNTQSFMRCSLSEDEISEVIAYDYNQWRINFLRGSIALKNRKLNDLFDRLGRIQLAASKVQTNMRKLRLNQDILTAELSHSRSRTQ